MIQSGDGIRFSHLKCCEARLWQKMLKTDWDKKQAKDSLHSVMIRFDTFLKNLSHACVLICFTPVYTSMHQKQIGRCTKMFAEQSLCGGIRGHHSILCFAYQIAFSIMAMHYFWKREKINFKRTLRIVAPPVILAVPLLTEKRQRHRAPTSSQTRFH